MVEVVGGLVVARAEAQARHTAALRRRFREAGWRGGLRCYRVCKPGNGEIEFSASRAFAIEIHC